MKNLLAIIDLYDDDDTRVGLKKGGNFNPKGVNQHTANMKTIEEIVKIKEANPELRPKNFVTKKLLTRDDVRRAKEAGIEFPTGKIKKKGDNRNVDRLALSKRRSSPSLETKLAAPKKSGLNFHHAGFKESLTDLKNTMYIPGSPNRKMAKLFEDPLLKEMEAFTKVFDDVDASPLEKQKAATDYLKNDRALRQKYPEFKNFKTRLSFRRTALDPSGIMVKEKLPDSSLAISQEPGMTLKGETPSTPRGQLILEFGKNDLQKLAAIGCPGKMMGGRVGFSKGQNLQACVLKGVEKLKGDPGKLTGGDQANLRAISKSTKAARLLKNILGPAAIAGEVLIEGGIAANKFMDEGVPIKQALGQSYINKYILGPKSQIDVEAERAKEFARGEEFAMAERGRRKKPFMAQSAQADELRRIKAMKKMEQAFPTTSPREIDEILKTQGMTIQDFGITYPQIQDFIKRDEQMQAIADAGGVANLAGGGIAKEAGDPSGAMLESMNPDSQGLSGLLKRVKKG